MRNILLVNFIVLLIGLLIIEFLFGDIFFEGNLIRLRTLRSQRSIFDVSSLYPWPAPYATYTRDALGLRGDYNDISNLDIITLGGSTTDQRYIDDSATWQAVLSDCSRRKGRALTVANAGYDGRSTKGHFFDLNNWLLKIPQLKTRFYLFYAGINDLYRRADFYDAPRDAGHSLGSLIERSALWNLWQIFRGVYGTKTMNSLGHHRMNFDSINWVQKPAIQNHAEVISKLLDEYKARIMRLQSIASSKGANVIWVTQPAHDSRYRDGVLQGASHEAEPVFLSENTFKKSKLNGLDKRIMLDLLNRTTLEVCRQSGAVCLDLARELDLGDDDFYDFHHTTPTGSRKIGEYLCGKLITP